MPDRSYRWMTAAVAVALVALLAGCSAPATGVGADGAAPGPGPSAGPAAAAPPTDVPPTDVPATDVPAAPLRVLHLNLCNSGIAGCYTGRAVAEAATVIRAETPDLVTLNEVCRDDVSALERALVDTAPGSAATSAFQPARNATTGSPYRCRNGQEYGIGIVSRSPPAAGSAAGGGGIYPAQDSEDPEQRAWLCLQIAATPAVTACTTHLAYTERRVAIAQCRYLFETVVAGMRARPGAAPVVLAGDLNLGSGDSADLRSCLPAEIGLVDDGGQQHVMATPDLTVGAARTIDLRDTTDHPGLLVTVTPR